MAVITYLANKNLLVMFALFIKFYLLKYNDAKFYFKNDDVLKTGQLKIINQAIYVIKCN